MLDKIAFLLRGAGAGPRDGEVERAARPARRRRTTDVLIDELTQAAGEGFSVVASSPFRVRHRGAVRQMAELVEPLDLALRNTRVLVRRAAVSAYRGDPVPAPYAEPCAEPRRHRRPVGPRSCAPTGTR